jgi:hypothetical protein
MPEGCGNTKVTCKKFRQGASQCVCGNAEMPKSLVNILDSYVPYVSRKQKGDPASTLEYIDHFAPHDLHMHRFLRARKLAIEQS